MAERKCAECSNLVHVASSSICDGGCHGVFCNKHLKEYRNKFDVSFMLCTGCYDNYIK